MWLSSTLWARLKENSTASDWDAGNLMAWTPSQVELPGVERPALRTSSMSVLILRKETSHE